LEKDKNFFFDQPLARLAGHQDGGWRRVPHTLCRLFQTCRLRESLDDALNHLLPWDIELIIDDPVDEPEEEPEV
jgi:hypothetical protein